MGHGMACLHGFIMLSRSKVVFGEHCQAPALSGCWRVLVHLSWSISLVHAARRVAAPCSTTAAAAIIRVHALMMSSSL